MNRQLSKINLPLDAKAGFEASLIDKLRKQDSDIIDQINSQVQGVGTPLSSAPTLSPTNAIHHVTGTAAVSNIALPPNFTGDVTLIADDGFSTVTGGNIAAAVSAPAGRAIRFTSDGSMLYPLVSA